MHRRTAMGSPATECPYTLASPSEGGMKPVSTFIIVLLPAPFGPRKPTTSPAPDLEGDIVQRLLGAIALVTCATVMDMAAKVGPAFRLSVNGNGARLADAAELWGIMRGTVLRSTGSRLPGAGRRWHAARLRGQGPPAHQGWKSTSRGRGRRVTFDPQTGPDEAGGITDLHDRRNYLVRKSVNLSHQRHVIAANVDQALLMVTPGAPQDLLRLHRPLPGHRGSLPGSGGHRLQQVGRPHRQGAGTAGRLQGHL